MFSALDYSIEAEKRRKQLLKPKPKFQEANPSLPGSTLVRTALDPSPPHLRTSAAAPAVSNAPGAWNAVPKQAVPTFERNPPQTGYPNVGLVDGTAGGVVPPRPYQPIQIPGRTPPLAKPAEFPKSGSMANDIATMGGTLLRRAAVGYAAGSAGGPGGGIAGVVGALSPQTARPSAPVPLAKPQPGQPAPPPLAMPRPQPGASYGSQNPAGQGQSTTIPATGGQDADRQRMQNQLLALKDQRMAFQRQEFALPAGDPGREQYRRAQVMVANQINQLEQGLRYNPDAAAPAQRTIVDVGNARTALRQKGDAMLEDEKRDLMLKVAQKSIPPEAMARAQARIAEINDQRAKLDERLPDLHGQDLDRTTAGVNTAAQSQFQRSQSEGASRYANARDDSAQAFKARADKFEYDSAMRRAELARVNADTRASEQSGTDSGAAAIKAEADRVEAQTRLEKSKTDAGMAKTLGTVQADENRETEFASGPVGRAVERAASAFQRFGGSGSLMAANAPSLVAAENEFRIMRREIEKLPPDRQAAAKDEAARILAGAGLSDSGMSIPGMVTEWINSWGGATSNAARSNQNTRKLRELTAEMLAYFGANQ